MQPDGGLENIDSKNTSRVASRRISSP